MKLRRKKIPLNLICFVSVLSMMVLILWGNRGITAFSEHMEVERKQCIIIDAGHGGEDGGATSCSGKAESHYNLEIALRLNDLLHFLGWKTKMIRTNDTSVYTKGETIAQKKVSDLKERVRICNETDGAVLISIHQNNFPDARYSGAQVFYGEAGDSQALAKQIQDTFKQTVNPNSNRQIKKAEGIYLMDHIQCTGVLIECGFLSNHQEEAKLRDAAYQKQLCSVIASTVANYLDG